METGSLRRLQCRNIDILVNSVHYNPQEMRSAGWLHGISGYTLINAIKTSAFVGLTFMWNQGGETSSWINYVK